MPPLPTELLDDLEAMPGFDRQAFEAVHNSGQQVTAIRVNPLKVHGAGSLDFQFLTPVPWTKYGYYLPERPSFTFDPLFHAGSYYVQEASSMFLEQAFMQTADLSQPLTVLDLCAAPGGKSTHLQSLITSDSVLVSNELIRTRVNILTENITKWGAANTIVTNNDPSDFGALQNLFDIVVVDAPCSGSGLFRKDPEAINEWSLANVQHCSLRQQRILGDVWPCLKPGGVLIYSTCSYSIAEDEMISDWLTETVGAANIPLMVDKDWGIVKSISPGHKNKGYRFYPHNLKGEGFYLACFRKPGEETAPFFSRPPKLQVDKKVIKLAAQWLKEDNGLSYYQHKEQVFVMPRQTLHTFFQVQANLNIRKAGIKVGDLARDEIIPDHALALSGVYHPGIKTRALSKDDAIQFLRRTSFDLDFAPKGWLMVTYQSSPLGFIKNLGNRVNNYYPKEWRIRR